MRYRGLKNGLKNYFTFTRGEQNGIIVLSVILLLVILFNVFLRGIVTSKSNLDPANYEKIDSFFSSLEYVAPNKTDEVEHSVLKEELVVKRMPKLFYFNPNTVDVDSLIDLGLSVKQAKVVVNYRNKGGRFRKPEDFAKIYAIDSATFQRLKAWIKIPEIVLKSDSTAIKPELEKIYIDINSADSVMLTKLKGIGRSYARRIVAYRNLLGGFYSIDQLTEVYGLNPATVSSIQSNIWVDSSRIRKLNLNLISYEELKCHPYLTDYQAKSIVYYRSKLKIIQNIEELVDNKLVPPDCFEKIKPYLTVK
ncbi:MAG: ComEA family DNA-binding protein [Bacteroidales bacterium]